MKADAAARCRRLSRSTHHQPRGGTPKADVTRSRGDRERVLRQSCRKWTPALA